MKRLIAPALAAAAGILVAAAWAGETQTWRQTTYEEFRRGNAENIAVSSDGSLSLAPVLEEIYEAPSSYLWDLAADAAGNVFVAAGPEAKVFRIGADGRKSVLFETEGVEVHAVAVDGKGNVYAATSPQSRIYKIDPSGASALFYDPRAAYVWDMVFDAAGDLYVATGDQGRIHRVKPSGDGEVFYETGETHVRSLAFDGKGNLIAGGDPGGLILRIRPAAEPEAFVLHQSGRKEITALVAAEDGTVYAAGVGLRLPVQAQQSSDAGGAGAGAGEGVEQLQSPPPAAFVAQVQGGSSIVRIAPGGEPREIWSDGEAVVYALALDAEGRLLIGAGDRGRVYRLDSEDRFTLLTTLASTQATALHRAADGSILVAASNIGKVYRLGPGLAAEGVFESEPMDAGGFARWGRLEWAGQAGGGTVRVAARSGNLNRPPRFWSPWSAATDSPQGAPSELPGARYAQWKATLSRGEGEPPVLDAVALAYRSTNTPPRVLALEIIEPNFRFPPRRPSAPAARALTLLPLGSPAARRPQAQTSPQTLAFSQGYQSARWAADDDSDDKLTYRVEIRGEGESVWILLEDGVEDPEVSFDSSAFADGVYRLRVVASDADANPLGEGLTGERVSEPFLVDNTAPVLSGLTAERTGSSLSIRFRAEDAATKIVRAEASHNGGPWRALIPESGLFDSRTASFSVRMDAAEGENVIAVRVADERGNTTVAKTAVR